MQHSIAAKYAARPAARFVRPSMRARERRLGLWSTMSFQAAPARPTVLRRADLGPFLQLKASWRAIRPERPRRPIDGHLRPAVTMRWARAGGMARTGSSSATSAPWLA